MAEEKVLKIEQAKPDYLICKECGNHITVRDELHFICLKKLGSESRPVGVFNAVINVRVDTSDKCNLLLLADVFCLDCGAFLGLRLVDILCGTQHITLSGKVYTLRKGMMLLPMERLSWRDGARTKRGIDVPFEF